MISQWAIMQSVHSIGSTEDVFLSTAIIIFFPLHFLIFIIFILHLPEVHDYIVFLSHQFPLPVFNDWHFFKAVSYLELGVKEFYIIRNICYFSVAINWLFHSAGPESNYLSFLLLFEPCILLPKLKNIADLSVNW